MHYSDFLRGCVSLFIGKPPSNGKGSGALHFPALDRHGLAGFVFV